MPRRQDSPRASTKDILWIAYKDKGISGYYVKSGFDMIAHYNSPASSHSEENITYLAELTDSTLLICAAESGVSVLNRKTGKYDEQPFGKIEPLHVLCALVNTQENELILGTLHRGVVTLKRSFFHNINNSIPDHGAETYSIPISGYQENDGTFWFGSVIRQAYRKGLSEPQTILTFRVPKHFLGTVPGVISALLVLLIFGYSIARFSSNREKNRLEKAIAAQDIKNREDKIAFLSNIAHELRTPLSLIYNPVKDFLQEKSVDGIDYERMERIFNQVNKMTVMVNMILDSSRADVNKADILIEEVNLNEWLNFLLEDYRIDCYGKGFSLKFIMDNSIGMVSIDKRIIETGLSNMVNNAIKYSNPGTAIIVSTQKTGDTIRVSVKDQGRGFSCDPEDLFKRYYRDNVDSSIPGYGLGLPYARLQLSLIGGIMSAFNNEDGAGSTFFMEFPSAPGKKNPSSHSASDSARKSKSAADDTPDSMLEGMAQDFDTNDMTVLYVCADNEMADSFCKEFESMFRMIHTANSGNDAVTLLNSTDIDLVVTDIDIPEPDGFELCRYIKSTLDISHIPVILLTSRSDERNKSLGYKMGADAFIPKPYDFKQMNTIIRSQLGGRFEIKRQYNFGFFSKMSSDQTFSVTDEEFIGSLNSLIEQFISDPSLNEDYILKQTGMTRVMMNRKMKGLLGTDLSNYLTRFRVSIVKDKLTGTDEDVESIAKQTGFTSVDAMNKAFKRETGKTLEDMREQ